MIFFTADAHFTDPRVRRIRRPFATMMDNDLESVIRSEK